MLSEKVIKKVTKIGEIESLTTENKDDIVSAINEVNEKTNNVSSNAEGTSFDNSNNGMKATNVQEAIEEVFQYANSGKELIATAIGSSISSDDTFNAMSEKINNLTNDFKIKLKSKDVTTTNEDKIDTLIEKISDIQSAKDSVQKVYSYGTYYLPKRTAINGHSQNIFTESSEGFKIGGFTRTALISFGPIDFSKWTAMAVSYSSADKTYTDSTNGVVITSIACDSSNEYTIAYYGTYLSAKKAGVYADLRKINNTAYITISPWKSNITIHEIVLIK